MRSPVEEITAARFSLKKTLRALASVPKFLPLMITWVAIGPVLG